MDDELLEKQVDAELREIFEQPVIRKQKLARIMQLIKQDRGAQELRHVKTVESTIQRMRPMMLNTIDGEEFAVYWDDNTQLWNRARYQDLIAEAKRQLIPTNSEAGRTGYKDAINKAQDGAYITARNKAGYRATNSEAYHE